ncbi:MAG: phosphoribosyltransferase family protein [Bdellovibrionota bacterium]
MEAQSPSTPEKILERANALVRNNHFIYSSGKHGSAYVNKDAVYTNPLDVAKLCEQMVLRIGETEIDTVVAPALGAVILGQWVAYYLSRKRDNQIVRSAYAEKLGDGFVLRRGYAELVKGKRVLIVEDILTTGGSVKKVIKTVHEAQGHVAGVVAICNRGAVRAEDLGPVPFLKALVDFRLETFEATQCPLCAKGIPFHPSLGKA